MNKPFLTHIYGPAFLLMLSLPAGLFALKVERMPVTAPAAAPGAAARGREVVSGEALVKFSPEISFPSRAVILRQAGFNVLKELEEIGWTLVGTPAGMPVSSALAVLETLNGVQACEPNGVHRPRRTPSDTYLALQYGIRKADALRAWDYEVGLSSRMTVAVIDTGIDGSHADLSPQLAASSQFFDPNDSGSRSINEPPTPACNHATRVAGVAAAASDNAYGISGISWGAKLISLKIFEDGDCESNCSDKGSNTCGSSDGTIAAAILYAANTLHNSAATGKVVVNMSIGQENIACSGTLQAAVTTAVGKGLVLTAAAGNDASSVNSPANCSGVIPVGATDINDNIASFSAVDAAIMTSTGISAPGVAIYTTDLNGGFVYADGTSFASPFAAGLAALLWSANTALTNEQIGAYLRNSADDLGPAGPDPRYGYGRVNAYKAMLFAVNGSTAAYTPQTPLVKAYAYPSPYKPGGRPLFFSIPDSILSAGMKIDIYTSEGEKVKTITSATWDGKNESGREVASGVYLFHVRTSKGKVKGKFAVLR